MAKRKDEKPKSDKKRWARYYSESAPKKDNTDRGPQDRK